MPNVFQVMITAVDRRAKVLVSNRATAERMLQLISGIKQNAIDAVKEKRINFEGLAFQTEKYDNFVSNINELKSLVKNSAQASIEFEVSYRV